MEKIQLITYPQSLAQADQLLDLADVLAFGEASFAIRLPAYYSREDQASLVAQAHARGKKALIVVNGLLHNAALEAFRAYLPFLVDIKADALQTGDPGVIQVMRDQGIKLPLIWDTQTLNTSAANLNFWSREGAMATVLSTELPQAELAALTAQLDSAAILQVYGAVGLHHSLRPFVSNYARHYAKAGRAEAGRAKADLAKAGLKATQTRPLFISEPDRPEMKYPLYEDGSGAHIFAAEDLNLLPVLDQLSKLAIYNWSLSSLFLEPETYVKIVALYRQAAQALEEGTWTRDLAAELNDQARALHPAWRPLGLGFFPLDPKDIA